MTLAALAVALATGHPLALLVFVGATIVWLMRLADAEPPRDRTGGWGRLALITLIVAPSAAPVAYFFWHGGAMLLGLTPYDDTWVMALVLLLPFAVTAPFAWRAYRRTLSSLPALS